MDAFGDAWTLIVEKLDGWWESAVKMLPNFVVALLVLLVFFGLAFLVRKIVRKTFSRVTDNYELRMLFGKIAFLLTFGVGFFIALGILDLDKTVTSLLAGAGVLGLALGFAFQDITANFISGVSLSIKRPFEVGDTVETNGQLGVVKEINLRSTVLDAFTGEVLSIPNKDVFQAVLINYSRNGGRRVDLDVGVAYDCDLDEVEKLAREAVKDLHTYTDKSIAVLYEEFGGSSINFRVSFWVDQTKEPKFLDAKSMAVKSIKARFEKAGIEIPFPVRTLDIPKEYLDKLGK